MRGYIGNTHIEWYGFLRDLPPQEEVNFWKPSTVSFTAQPGTPFFFRLKSPINAIAGFGIFARYVRSPLCLAWESFKEKNGAPDRETMRRQIERYHHGHPTAGGREIEIGCLMISSPIFFGQSEWVSEPHDWPRHVPPGMYYDLTHGEGRRIWNECRERAIAFVREDQPQSMTETLRLGAAQLVRPRLGQATFRMAVSSAYGRACAVTGEHSLPALEAAHIHRFADGGANTPSNGILLRADLHRLFDAGYVTVDRSLRFIVGRRLKEDFDNGRSYYHLDGQSVFVPRSLEDKPDLQLLARHNEAVFLG